MEDNSREGERKSCMEKLERRCPLQRLTELAGERAGILTIYMRKPEIPVGKSTGLRHSVWEASENMACDLR